MPSANHVGVLVSIGLSRAYPDSGEVSEAAVTKPLRAACMRAKQSRPKSIHGLFPLVCPPVLSRPSRPPSCALPVYKDPSLLPSTSPGFRNLLARPSVCPRPHQNFPWKRANGMKASTGTATCLSPRLFASYAGCAAINTNGGVRRPKYQCHATKPWCAVATNSLETIAARRTVQLSRRAYRTVWM